MASTEDSKKMEQRCVMKFVRKESPEPAGTRRRLRKNFKKDELSEAQMLKQCRYSRQGEL
jgi:hypothetical protein